ncbi:hypothetical protein [Rossellomorea aquimaris]|uniref:Uncharacterized protein n=1 Tax=Rossellomorea aquimaris TaxID=189382 RepID=A0A366EER1_9BACI|nr:hypothetical protein [Rossellomorea aquimaris]RBP00813.1 hypothetical protein DET59_12415 [Rossellomorea aquimaris]
MSQILENYDAELRKEGERLTLLRLVQSHLSRKKSDDYIMDALEISQEELDNLIKALAEHKKI